MSITENFRARAMSREKARKLADELLNGIVTELRNYEDSDNGLGLIEKRSIMERALTMVHSEVQAIIRNAQQAGKDEAP